MIGDDGEITRPNATNGETNMITLPSGPPAPPSSGPQYDAPVTEADTSQAPSYALSTSSGSSDLPNATAFQKALDQEQVRSNSPPASVVTNTDDGQIEDQIEVQSAENPDPPPTDGEFASYEGEKYVPGWAPPPAAGEPLPADGSKRKKGNAKPE